MGRLARGMTVLALLFFFGFFGPALAQEVSDVPPSLAAWRGWVLAGAGDKLCPTLGNAADTRLCLFPSNLSLTLDATGADVSFRMRLFIPQAVALPSGKDVIVAGMTADAKPVAVADRDGTPIVWLPAGEHTLSGRLAWDTMPESLRLPPDVGLVRVRRGGQDLPVVLGPGGEVRLGGESAVKTVENREDVRVFRLVADGVPVTVTTRYQLAVSGLARTIVLAGAVPPGAVPLGITTPSPATLGPDGSLSLDAGPGRYAVEVLSRYPGRLESVGPAACPYGREIWSFAASRSLREVRPEGAPAIDPQTVDVPQEWRGYPAFAIEPGASLALRELGRGAPVGRDSLTLTRELWLDFSGKGLTSRDGITGENRTAWTLTMLPPGELGRVTLAGRDQPLVLLGKDKLAGVELRESRLRMAAEARYPVVSARLPATGYDREFEKITTSLHLPPGWRLLAANGPDRVWGAMLSGWSLLDLFCIFLLAMAGAVLAGRPAGIVLGALLLLTWHEPDAPTFCWIFVLAGLGLLRVTGQGGRLAGSAMARRWAVLLAGLAFLALIVLAVPFAVTQLRQAVAPQIDSPERAHPAVLAMRDTEAMAPPPAPSVAPRAMSAKGRSAAPQNAVSEEKPLDFDPDAVIQTGPGLPTWHWRTVELAWNGPVSPGQTFRLILLPPFVVSGLAILRVALLGLVLWLVGGKAKGLRRAGASSVLAGCAVLLVTASGTAWAQGYPSSELLEELASRLTAAPQCAPHCLGSSALELAAGNGRLRLVSTVDAAARSVAPLPVVSENWRPDTVQVDGAPAAGLTRQDGGLKVLLEPGRHSVVQEGPIPDALAFSVELPLAPGRILANAPGYRVRRLAGSEGRAAVLECVRAEKATAGPPRTGGSRLPAFFEVHRTLDFGLPWSVTTEVVRRSPDGDAATVAVPLLPGEQPDIAEATVKDGQALVSFMPGVARLSWHSRLPAVSRLTLAAPTDLPLAETWTLAAAPFYDVTFAGLAPTARLGAGGTWQPQFMPWPGEKLTVDVTRPEPAPGAVCTLEKALLTTRQGAQSRDVTVSLTYRSAKGGRQSVVLPAGAAVQSLTVAGRETLPTGQNGEVGFSLPPGLTDVAVRFRETVPLGLMTRTPSVDLRLPAVNVVSRLELPHGRWLLAAHGATPMGPVVLFWGWLLAVLAVGWALSLTRLTPLSRRQWLLLSLGLVQAEPVSGIWAVGWLLGLGWRRRFPGDKSGWSFNLVQLALIVLTLAGLFALYETLQSGLLGLPRVQVGGGGSTATSLVWTFDRVAASVPVSWVASVPLLVFRVLMLAWALWLALRLIAWLRWGFDCITEGGFWRPLRMRLTLPGRKTSSDNDK